jgi:methylase of polypeptide subunit release factors
MNNIYKTGGSQIVIEYPQELNGGGTWMAKNFVIALEKVYPNRKFKSGLEWCSGPGFIGFELLARQLCSEMDFMDLHPPALENIKNTIKSNNLDYNIDCILADRIEQLPNKKYDLIVGNPPHFNKKNHPRYATDADLRRRTLDIDLSIHKNFFNCISDFLSDDGVIVICETYSKRMTKEGLVIGPGIHFHELSPLIASNGFVICDIHTTKNRENYYMVLKKK